MYVWIVQNVCLYKCEVISSLERPFIRHSELLSCHLLMIYQIVRKRRNVPAVVMVDQPA